MAKSIIGNKHDFNCRLQALNPTLEAVSEYEGKNKRIGVKCLQCNRVMWHRTAHAWLYEGAKCYFCDDLSFNRAVETYASYVERKTENKISPIEEYENANRLILFRCNQHGVTFRQSHSELFRKDGKSGGSLCEICSGRKRKKKYEQEELLALVRKYAPNIKLLSVPKTMTGKVKYICSDCGYDKGETQINILIRSKEGKKYCPNCNKILKKNKNGFDGELKKKNSHLSIVGEYISANDKIQVYCDKCKKIMSHKTPQQWLRNPKCYYCDQVIFNPEVEEYGDYVQRTCGDNYLVLSDNWGGAKKPHLYFCKKHEVGFWQTPDSFAHNNANCCQCRKINNEIWIKKRTKKHDEYVEQLASVSPKIEVLGQYKSNREQIAVRCRVCTYEWAPTAGPLLHQQTKCPICTGATLTSKLFRERVKKASPDIDIIGRYRRGKGYIDVECKKCKNTWTASKDVLLRGCGCKLCAWTGTSRQELMLFYTLKEIWPNCKILHRNHNLIGKELDIVIKDKNIAIEIGHYHYHKDKIGYDESKEHDCVAKDIVLYTFYFGCGDDCDYNNESVSFDKLTCYAEDATNKDQIIELTKKCLSKVARDQGWVVPIIDYDRVWQQVMTLRDEADNKT